MAANRHDYWNCRDDDCPRLACRAYKDGYGDGFADGMSVAAQEA
jgi:hypothetical protein